MKIVHLCMNSVVTDGFTYQDNLLSKFHKRLGNDVYIITSPFVFNTDGQIVRSNRLHYVNADGVTVIRLKPRKASTRHSDKIKHFQGMTSELIKIQPDVIFIHGVQFMEVPDVVKFLKNNKNTKVFVDNHADGTNSGRNFLSYHILHRILWRHMAHILEPFTTKFYGVLPSRVDWLIDVYGLPAVKCALLVMGADDDQVKRVRKPGVRSAVRERLGIRSDDFLIVSGGKIDIEKQETLNLMRAVATIKDPRLKLIIFGSVDQQIRQAFDDSCKSNNISYLGWVSSDESYDLFVAADIGIFPGRHSVYWEQAAGTGLPLICREWPGTRHVDLGGNVKFLKRGSESELRECVCGLLENTSQYLEMRKAAQEKSIPYFSYLNIARRSLG